MIVITELHGMVWQPPLCAHIVRCGGVAGCSYVCYLIFQLKTHHDLFEGEGDEEEPMLSITTAMFMLALITIIVAIASE